MPVTTSIVVCLSYVSEEVERDVTKNRWKSIVKNDKNKNKNIKTKQAVNKQPHYVLPQPVLLFVVVCCVQRIYAYLFFSSCAQHFF